MVASLVCLPQSRDKTEHSNGFLLLLLSLVLRLGGDLENGASSLSEHAEMKKNRTITSHLPDREFDRLSSILFLGIFVI